MGTSNLLYAFFADDSIIYRKISSKTDHEILQNDLNQLETWSDKWQMEFNVSKCVHLPITNKTKPSPHKYLLFGQPLSTVSRHSYLGIKLDSKLTWTNHITDITSKSSKVLKRTLGPCKPEVKQTAYNMLIQPKLEYSSPTPFHKLKALKEYNTLLSDLLKIITDGTQIQQI